MKQAFVKVLKKSQTLNQLFKVHTQGNQKQAVSLLKIDDSVFENREYEESKPFSEIPGPKGLPFIGTYFHYRLGMNYYLLFSEITNFWVGFIQVIFLRKGITFLVKN